MTLGCFFTSARLRFDAVDAYSGAHPAQLNAGYTQVNVTEFQHCLISILGRFCFLNTSLLIIVYFQKMSHAQGRTQHLPWWPPFTLVLSKDRSSMKRNGNAAYFSFPDGILSHPCHLAKLPFSPCIIIIILELQNWKGPYGSLSPAPVKEAQRGTKLPTAGSSDEYSGASHSEVNPFWINLRYAEASLNGAGISIGMH